MAVYGPNRDDPTFYQSLQSKIEIIGNTSVIIGDYWNMPLNYEIDTENYVNKNNPKAQQKIHALMAELDLLDVWRKIILQFNIIHGEVQTGRDLVYIFF